jgi:hypothetical protein
MSTDQEAPSPPTSDILPSSPLSSLNHDLDVDDIDAAKPIPESGHPLTLLELAKQIVERDPASSFDTTTEEQPTKRKKYRKKKNKGNGIDICGGMTPAERKAFTYFEDICVHYDRNHMEGDLQKYGSQSVYRSK